MAGTLDIAVVAEGIENDVVMDQLREANCRYGQGFLVSRPLPVEQIEPMLIRRVLHENEHIELV
jgi:EAL domain-containing protein (putative c-di-GMP-specific phosphodiesterase class I)